MNRQARHANGQGCWIDYGEVTFMDAAEDHAKLIAKFMDNPEFPISLQVDVRDKDDTTIPMARFDVIVALHATITNPRQGSD